MKKVLHVISGMGTGGAEKDIINWYRNIDREEYQFDFLIRSDEMFYKKEIERLGGQIFRVADFPSRLFRNIIETNNFFKTHKEYDAVHVHGNALIYIYPLILAKKNKIPVRIMHSHNTKANGKLSSIIHYINRYIIDGYVNCRLACSKEAGEFAYKQKKFTVINNAMDLKKFVVADNNIREELGISNEDIVFGHIGRFLPVKNQTFLIDIFSEIIKRKSNAKLLLIGSGEMREKIEKKVNELNLSDSVFFLGERNNIEQMLNYIDMIIFPSLYEGVPLVVLEAQASRTKVVYSDRVDPNVKITDYVREQALDTTAKEWAQTSLQFLTEEINCDVQDAFCRAGYTIENVVDKLVKIYEGDIG